MSMEHKAFVFDSNSFNRELKEVIIKSVKEDNPKPIYKFIDSHIGDCASPYSGEELDKDWKEELEEESLQELCDFALTCYYDINEDVGLLYSWDALLNILKDLDLTFEGDYYILGKSFMVDEFTLDPGCMGTGFVEATDIPKMKSDLFRNKDLFLEKINFAAKDESLLYTLSTKELEDAYNELMTIYDTALSGNKGIFMTF